MKEFFELEKTINFNMSDGQLKPSFKDHNRVGVSENDIRLFLKVKNYATSVRQYVSNPPVTYSRVIGVDIETTGLNFQTDQIRLIAIYDVNTQCVEEDIRLVSDVLADPKVLKIFHNASFDVTFLRYQGVKVESFTDTLIMEQILTNTAEMRSLTTLSQKYLGKSLCKSLQAAQNWQSDLTDEHRQYCLDDARTAFELYGVMYQKIVDAYLYPTYYREIKALPAIIELKSNGISLDFNKWLEKQQELEDEFNELKVELQTMLKCENLNSSEQVLESFQKLGIPINNVQEKTLSNYAGFSPVVAKFIQFKKMSKLFTTYGPKYVKHLSKSNSVHADWRLIGAATARMSCSNPNLQSIPKQMRAYFKPLGGNVFVIADYSTIELRILAQVSGCVRLIKLLNEGADLHVETAKAVFHKQEVNDTERQVGKAINFGLIYGLTPFGLVNQINAIKGMKITEADAQQFMNLYFGTYPEVKLYQTAQRSAEIITTLGGRYWDGTNNIKDLKPRQRFNYAIQASCAEGLKESLHLIMSTKQVGWKVVSAIHDEIILEVPKADGEEAKLFLENQMIAGMATLIKDVPILVDSKVSKNLEK